MCGIIGYIGKQKAAPILLEGLRQLEYRGYDSAGISVIENDKIKTIKATGKVVALTQKMKKLELKSTVGIAHTRWATHGKPCDTNSHPHGDCQGDIFLVHNGIIENYQELKKILLKKGHRFVSETDSEIIAHHRKILVDKNTAVVAISQSGETADTLAAIREAKKQGALILGIVNVVGSTIARETEAGTYALSGPEIGVASTKAFTSQLTALTNWTLTLGRQRTMSYATSKRIAQELKKIPDLIESVLKKSGEIKKIAGKYSTAKDFLYLGRKYNFPIALEGALKIKEISYVHAEGYPSGEMKHGPLALIDKTFPAIFITPRDSVYAKNISGMMEIKARGGRIIAIATEGDKEIGKIADDVIYIPKTLELLTPFLSIIPLQLFAYYFGVAKDLDVDKPRNLAKSVTVE